MNCFKNTTLFVASMMLAFLPYGARAQKAMSLSECIQYAYNNHPEMRLAQLQIQDAEWQLKENTATGLPQLSAGIDFQHFLKVPALPAEALGFQAPPGTRLAFQLKNSIGGNVQYSQLLFSNSYLLAIKASRYYREYVQIQLEAARHKTRNEVIDAYLPALLLTENLSLMDKNIGNLEKMLSDTREIFKAGFAEQLDVDRLELALNSLKSERDNLQRQQAIVVDALKFTIGFPVQEEMTPSDQLEQLMETYADADLTSELNPSARPEYLQILKARQLGSIQTSLYQKTWLPTVAGFISASGAYQGNDKLFWVPTAVTGVSVSVPLWDGGGTKAKRERAMIEERQIEIQKDMLENAFSLELSSARKQYMNALERIENKERNLQLADRVYTTTRKKYDAGIGSSFELVTAEQQVFEAQQGLLQAQYDLLNTRISIKKALGQL
jgi:outer membrane protein TolC